MESKSSTTANGKKGIRAIELVLIAVLGVIVAFLLATVIYHRVMTDQEMSLLKENGYVNPVSVGDYSLNVAKFGNPDGKHTIVALAGLGMGDFSVLERKMTSTLEKENQVVFVDRAGYGLSDDSNKKMTVENIVEDYRKALKNDGIEGPYILMPHSIAGVYTSYWVSNYPEEVEAVVFLDGTQMTEDFYLGEGGDGENSFNAKAESFFLKLGFGRYVLNYFTDGYPDLYTKDEKKMCEALKYMTLDSYSTGSEGALITKNVRSSWASIVTNDVPKLYICASWGFDTEDYENARQTRLYPYLEKLGSCKTVLLPGSHNIFVQYPDECGRIVKEFVDGLD